MQLKVLRHFLRLESSSGIILFAMGVAALILSNTPLSEGYHAFFQAPLTIRLGEIVLNQPLLFWINEGLMTIFFLLVGLELKRELIGGELSAPTKFMLPGIAACGGMLVPAVIYLCINHGNIATLSGWAIPMATDIAFALGILSLFGKRVPLGLKLFLMALAIFDDVGAIIVIAIFYTSELSFFALLIAALLFAGLLVMNALGVRRLTPYMLLGFVLWVCMLKSGVHATVAGILLAFAIPHKKYQARSSPLYYLEKELHPWVAFGVMPLFALANAGVSFSGLSLSYFFNSITLGIFAGLFFGKQIGVVIFSWVSVRLGWATLPEFTNWFLVYGVALLCGVGFTMSLFLGTLAFQGSDTFLVEVRLGVLSASITSGIVGSMVLYYALQKRKL
jgi:NhaA family Na+:H+ antiporter